MLERRRIIRRFMPSDCDIERFRCCAPTAFSTPALPAGCISLSSSEVADVPDYLAFCKDKEAQCKGICAEVGVQSFSCKAAPCPPITGCWFLSRIELGKLKFWAIKNYMKISDLLPRWSSHAHAPMAGKHYHLQLQLRDAARIEALQIMYPDCSEEEILSDLLHAALDELEVAMPYVPGKRIIAEDDHGDPIYEDLGPTPRFYSLSHELMRKLTKKKPDGEK